MKSNNIKLIAAAAILFTVFSCQDLDDVNNNTNAITADVVNPNLVMPVVLSSGFDAYVKLGYGDVAGVMQHTQKDAWFSSHNDYDWSDQSWTTYYGVLRNNELLYNRSVELGLEFHQGVALVMKSAIFGLITDIWGDAPYTEALEGDEGNIFPAFDDQETIYTGIIADLITASELLSKDASEYPELGEDLSSIDIIYGGDPLAWRRFANSLLLRYYMRVSDKLPDLAKAGIERIGGDLSTYPVIDDASEDAVMDYVGSSSSDSWPTAVFSSSQLTNYARIRPCATLVDKMQEFGDPRLALWFKKVQIPLVVDASLPAGTDELVDTNDDGVNDVRYLSPDVVDGISIDTDPDYVGIPPSVSSIPSAYNLGPNPGQTSVNPHVSYLNEVYSEASGGILKARFQSAAEVNFILAEAALKGYSVSGTAEDFYNAGVQASLQAWGVGDDYSTYISQAGVTFDDSGDEATTLNQILTQKWIASWTAATESWFDFRRTGLPAFVPGVAAQRTVLPVRFYYMNSELDINTESANAALARLDVANAYVQSDGANSAWAKPWIIQGTGTPWE